MSLLTPEKKSVLGRVKTPKKEVFYFFKKKNKIKDSLNFIYFYLSNFSIQCSTGYEKRAFWRVVFVELHCKYEKHSNKSVFLYFLVEIKSYLYFFGFYWKQKVKFLNFPFQC